MVLTEPLVTTRGPAQRGYLSAAPTTPIWPRSITKIVVEFTVNAPVAGTYHLNIHYTNGTGANSQQGLSINGGPFTFVTYPVTEGWGLFGINSMDIQLQSGVDLIRLAKGDPSFGLAVGYAELDCIDLQYSYP
jgi:hypothetical protein